MGNNNRPVKIVECGNCGFHGIELMFFTNFSSPALVEVKKEIKWDGRSPYNGGWLQSVFRGAICPKCEADYTSLDIYPKDNLLVSLFA